MQTNKTQKIILGFLIFSQITFWPLSVFAQGFFGVTTPATPTWVNDGNSTAVADIPILASIKAAAVANQTCLVGDAAATAATTVARGALSGLDAISGGGTLVAALTTESAKLETAIACHQAVLTTLTSIVTPDSLTANQLQIVSNSANDAIAALKTKLEPVTQQLNVASGNVWKALMITILINTTKAVADQLVNKLVNNYKIANLKTYTDSVATLMYDNQFLRDNFPAAQDQMMARQILTNPLARTQIQPGIYTQANNALGYTPSTLSPSDPNFYTKMAMAGSSPANPYFLQTVYVSGVDQSHANSVATAQAHISQGSGYKAPVNCSGSLAQQKQIDSQANASQAQLANRQALLDNLLNAQAAGQKVSASDIAKARADVNAANTAWQNLPFTVTGNNAVGNAAANGGNNVEGTAAIVMCEAVSSPAVLVNQGIDAVFKSLNLGQYNNSNLPGFLSAISGIATQIGSSLVLGGITGGSVSINENQAINAGVTAATAVVGAAVDNNIQANLAKGINFGMPVSSGSPNGYTVSWQVITSQIPTASYVSISGSGINTPTAHLPLTGSLSITTTLGGNYTLTVFNSVGGAITTATQVLPVTTQTANSGTSGGLTYNSSGPIVAGAFTNKPQLNIRGPQQQVSPRGE